MKQRKTLILGASTDPSRYSYMANTRLQSYGHPVVALGRKEGDVGDVSITTELKPFENIDTITLYLNPMNQKEYYDYIISLNPKRVIFNPGTENPELFALLKKAHIEIDVACTLVLLSTNQY